MTKLVLETDEPTIAIHVAIPVRLLPQLVAILAAAATPAAQPCVYETTAEEAPTHPGVVKAAPANVVALRRIA